MVSSPRIESLAERFAPYIDELHEFFRSRHVPFGTTSDLIAFPARLEDPAFHEEMVSMMRSVLYRESEALPRSGMMELIAFAVGGSVLDEAEPALQDTLRRILAFATEVVRSQRGQVPQELPDEVGEALAAAPQAPLYELEGTERDALPPVTTRASLQELSGTPGLGTAAALPTTLPAPTPPPQSPEPLPTNDRLSRALSDSADLGSAVAFVPPVPSAPEAKTAVAADASTENLPLPSAVSGTPSVQVISRQRRSLLALLRRAYWIPGVCALLLVLGVVALLRHPAVPPASIPVVVAPAPAVSASASKPSAYGAPLRTGSIPKPHPPVPEAADIPSDDATHSPSRSTEAVPRSATAPPVGAAGRHASARSIASGAIVPLKLPGAREGVFLASSGAMAAHLLSAPAPAYPKLASFAHVEGQVIVQVVVARDGHVEATRVLDGPRLLRGAAEHAIRRWRYRPYLVDGRATDVATIVTVSFRLPR